VDRTDGGKRKARIVVLLSGGGRTLGNLLERIDADALPLEIVHVVSTRRTVAGNQVAEDAGLPLSIIRRRDLESDEAFSQSIFEVAERAQADLIVCAGFLSKLEVLPEYMGRVVNIHPSILPLFGGKGFYGDAVHQAVLESGMRVSGCTVHFVDNAYDAGPIIAQRCVPVYPQDSVQSLAGRVFQQECRLYPQILLDIAQGNIQMIGRNVVYSENSFEQQREADLINLDQ
jgi:phosphoribosylglycinamide formyltransferase 1